MVSQVPSLHARRCTIRIFFFEEMDNQENFVPEMDVQERIIQEIDNQEIFVREMEAKNIGREFPAKINSRCSLRCRIFDDKIVLRSKHQYSFRRGHEWNVRH